MVTTVTLNIYSGRPNPSWALTAEQEKQLTERLASLSTVTDARPSGVAGGLGYRGFQVARHVEDPHLSARFHVHESIVDRGLGSANLATEPDLEKWLAGTARDEITDELREHIATRIAGAHAEKFTLNMAVAAKCPTNHAADAPAYNPGLWNVPNRQPYNNCYNYANDQMTNTFAQPGRATGHQATVMACNNVTPAAQSDGLKVVPNFNAPLARGQGWYVALVVWPNNDYHWYRQDNVGCWSHKPGQTAVRNVDNAGNAITNPQTCNRGPYTNFCTFMVTNRGVHIR
ncbi:MAG: hypothetical protein QOH32_2027 [Bradyrhizobium sp.]|jgi:hypothetical protein|nr:hypothetical protein [Bradyrhizobium sp.]